MAKINVCKNTMAMFMLCEAIGNERNEWKGLKPDKNGCYDINIQLNGKEINVERFLENLQRSYQEAVKATEKDSSLKTAIQTTKVTIEATTKAERPVITHADGSISEGVMAGDVISGDTPITQEEADYINRFLR
jgi:hypothetical protein